MSNPNGLLSQKLSHYLNQGRAVNDILMRTEANNEWLTLTLGY